MTDKLRKLIAIVVKISCITRLLSHAYIVIVLSIALTKAKSEPVTWLGKELIIEKSFFFN